MFSDNCRDYVFNYLKKKFPKARREDLEDVAQNTLVKAFRFKDNFNNECSWKTWLGSIAHNMYIDSLRKPYVKHENILESAESFHIFEDIREDDFSETFCNEDHLIKISDELLSGFENNVHVEAFRMNVIDDIGYKEIALIQNVAIGTIKSRVYRGKKLLRDKYIQICNQEACLLV
mgnify:CR=1 FL=1|jgi:RNA polymerase sigma-70 factor (ECF subfamily)